MARLLALRPPLIPQQARLNRAHPAARWCTALITFPNGAPVDWINRRTGTAWGTRPVARGHALGVACDSVAGGGYGGFWLADDAGRYTPQAYTHLLLCRVTAETGGYAGLFAAGSQDATANACGLQLSGSGGLVANYHAASGDTTSESSVAWPSQIGTATAQALAIASAGVPTRALYKNGVRLVEWGAGGAAPTAITAGRLVWFGERGASTSYATQGQIFLHAVFNRRLPEDLILDLTRAPEALIGV